MGCVQVRSAASSKFGPARYLGYDGRAPEAMRTGQETKTGAALQQQLTPQDVALGKLAGVSSTRPLLRQPKPSTILYNTGQGVGLCWLTLEAAQPGEGEGAFQSCG